MNYSCFPILPTPRRLRSNAAERAHWTRQYRQSGLTQREFARQHGLRLSTLQRWVAQQAHLTTTPPFTELKMPAVSRAAPWAAEVVREDGATLRLAHDVTPALLRQLLRAW
jgi:transposase-like protein